MVNNYKNPTYFDMKIFKLIAVFAVLFGAVGLNSAVAQSDDDPPPMMSSFSEEESGGGEEESYNSSVTIEEEGSKSIEKSYESTSSYIDAPRKERLRVYSGKHSGNNVVSDPRRDY